MWMLVTSGHRNEISVVMVVLVMGLWFPPMMIYTSGTSTTDFTASSATLATITSPLSTTTFTTSKTSMEDNEELDDEDDNHSGSPNFLFSRNRSPNSHLIPTLPPLRLEVIAILSNLNNISVGYSKALSRILNSVSGDELKRSLNGVGGFDPYYYRNVTWRVKNFVINNSNDTYGNSGDNSSIPIPIHARKGSKIKITENRNIGITLPNITFSPQLVPNLCDFLSKTKAVAMIDLIGNLAGEQVLSLISNSAALPLIGSSQYANPLDSLHKDKNDFYISLSTSVRQVALVLGRLLVSCHWHRFTVLFDDTPAIISSQMIWEEVLNRMTIAAQPLSHSNAFDPYQLHNQTPTTTPPSSSQSPPSEFYDYDQTPLDLTDEVVDYPMNEIDLSTIPVLKPQFRTIRTRSVNGALRVMSHITRETQGIIVLVCSDKSLVHVFRAAQKLRMLNGDYVFILAGPEFHYEVIPEWIPSGILALRSTHKGETEKFTTKRTGKLLASAFGAVKNIRIRRKQSSSSENPFSLSQGNRRVRENKENEESLKYPQYRKPFLPSTPSVPTAFRLLNQNSPSQKIRISSENLDSIENGVDGNIAKHPSQNRISRSTSRTVQDLIANFPNVSCWMTPPSLIRREVAEILTREIRNQMEILQTPILPSLHHRDVFRSPRGLESHAVTFDLINLIDVDIKDGNTRREWQKVGNVSMYEAHVKTIRWPGGRIFGPGDRDSKTYRVVTISSPPFVMEADAEDNKTCVIGLPCLRVNTTDKDELAVIFANFDRGNLEGNFYKLACCDGLAMDLLTSISRELKFEIDMFLVPDGYFGSRLIDGSWNGLMEVLVKGSAHMSFAPFSVTSPRSTAVDFSTPFFFSAVGFLGMSKNQDVPLMAFLAPFSFELWAAIFLTLNVTALAVALFEWLSPFGLNPWGRQRTKNFSIASALWVVWGRLFSHLVAFKAPKSWPNKFLINVWGGFSVIFVASYTANIAALFAGKFYERGLGVHDGSLLSQRVGSLRFSATNFYIKKQNQQLWEHLQKFSVHSFHEGIQMLKNNSLDLLIGDGPLLDYYRGSESSCNLIDVSNQDKIGDDTYAVAMTKGFPLKDSISTLISKYIENGYLDYLQGKWYGHLECFRRSSDLVRARALGVDSVAGMIIMLALGTVVGLLILTMELIVYKFALPFLRKQPKGTIWRSPNIMFFSQKLYRFINCVELVSPHHAAKELMDTLRQGQITSLFQKSVKRKEREQRRRRKSKAQFFEMIQEIRRVQKEERQQSLQRQDSIETRFSASPTQSSSTTIGGGVPIYSIQARLESNKQTPKVVRILGVDVDVANNGSDGNFYHQASSTIPEVPEEDQDGENGGGMTTVDLSRKRQRLHRTMPGDPLTGKKGGGIVAILDPGIPPDNTLLPVIAGESCRKVKGECCRTTNVGGGGCEDPSNLNQLTKAEIIQLWKSSENELKEQLSSLMKEKDRLLEKLEKLQHQGIKPP